MTYFSTATICRSRAVSWSIIAPPFIRFFGDNKDAVLAQVGEKLPIKRVAASSEVARAVIFLMKNDAVTGEVLHIDGGGRLV